MLTLVLMAVGLFATAVTFASRSFRRAGGSLPHRPYRRAYGDAPAATDGPRALASDSLERLDTLTRGTR